MFWVADHGNELCNCFERFSSLLNVMVFHLSSHMYCLDARFWMYWGLPVQVLRESSVTVYSLMRAHNIYILRNISDHDKITYTPVGKLMIYGSWYTDTTTQETWPERYG